MQETADDTASISASLFDRMAPHIDHQYANLLLQVPHSSHCDALSYVMNMTRSCDLPPVQQREGLIRARLVINDFPQYCFEVDTEIVPLLPEPEQVAPWPTET